MPPGYPNVILALRIGKRPPFIHHEPQHFRFIIPQTFKQISCFRLFRTASFPLRFVWWRAFLHLLQQNSQVSLPDDLALGLIELAAVDIDAGFIAVQHCFLQ